MAGNFHRICRADEVVEGSVKTFKINDRAIAVARYEGIIYAIDDLCTHDGGDLSEGDVVKGDIQCPRHGARFSLKTGKATRMPAVEDITTYEVKIENGEVYIEME